METRTEQYYHGRLKRYFDRNYGPYEETAEFYNNPAINKWKFIIRELGIEVELTCRYDGRVFEKRNRIEGTVH